MNERKNETLVAHELTCSERRGKHPKTNNNKKNYIKNKNNNKNNNKNIMYDGCIKFESKSVWFIGQ